MHFGLNKQNNILEVQSYSFLLIKGMYVDLLKQPIRECNADCLLRILRVKDNAVLKHPIPKSNKAIEYGLNS